VIDELHGAYATGPDVGTGPDDMVTIASRTRWVFCRPVEAGGSGDSSPATAAGTVAALRALCAERFGSADLSRRSFAILGLGRVGGEVARLLAASGAKLLVSDVDESRRELAAALGARWVNPADCQTAEVDVLVPAAMGGLLTPATVATLRCRAVAGPANNQLDAFTTADLLHRRGILWAPDPVVSAGGIIHATAVELRHRPEAEAIALVDGIGDTLTAVLRAAAKAGVSPAEITRRASQEAAQKRTQTTGPAPSDANGTPTTITHPANADPDHPPTTITHPANSEADRSRVARPATRMGMTD
jgi:leucine dehydrogenase